MKPTKEVLKERERIKKLIDVKVEAMLKRREIQTKKMFGKMCSTIPKSLFERTIGIILLYIDNPNYKRTTDDKGKKK